MQLTTLEYIIIVSTLLEFNPLLQAVKSVRTRNVEDLSVYTFIAISLIGLLWLYYGFTIGNVPIIVGNAIKLFTSLAVIFIYIRFHLLEKKTSRI